MDGGGESPTPMVSLAALGDDFVAGKRVTELTQLRPGALRVGVRLLDDAGEVVAEQRARVQLRGSLAATLLITRDCADAVCPRETDSGSQTECVSNQCVPPECTFEDHDDPACAPGCTSDAECPRRSECAVPSCLGGACLYVADDSVCEERCHLDDGCVVEDCAGRCDDGEPCTDDTCVDGECQHTLREGSCDDGVFCNGEDVCVGGTCSAHAGDPCEAPTRCDEASAACLGECTDDADCPADELGDFSVCAGFTDACDQGGERTRDVVSFACSAGTCTSSRREEREPCARVTDGTACDDDVFCNGLDRCADGACSVHPGDPCPGMSVCDETVDMCTGCATTADCPPEDVPAFSECSGFDDVCDPTGSHSRTRTRYTCVTGVCRPTEVSETEDCTRDTRGDACDDLDPCNGPDECSGGRCINVGPPLGEGARCGTPQDRCCGGACTNTAASPNHCGGCNIRCPSVCRRIASSGVFGGVCLQCSDDGGVSGCPAAGWACPTFDCPWPECPTGMCDCAADDSLCAPGQVCRDPGGGGLRTCRY